MNKQDQIFQAALKLFITYGYDKTPTAQIAKEAGIATGTLFHYFPTKEELVNSLYLHCKDTMTYRCFLGVSDEKTFRGKMRRIYENALKWGVTCKEEFLFFQQFSNSPNILDATRKEGESRFLVFCELIRQGLEQELLKDIDPDLLMTNLLGMLSANILYAMSNPSLIEEKEFVEATFTLIWDAVKR